MRLIGRRGDNHVSLRFEFSCRTLDRLLADPNVAPSSRGLGRWPFKPETRIRIPLGLPRIYTPHALPLLTTDGQPNL